MLFDETLVEFLDTGIIFYEDNKLDSLKCFVIKKTAFFKF